MKFKCSTDKTDIQVTMPLLISPISTIYQPVSTAECTQVSNSMKENIHYYDDHNDFTPFNNNQLTNLPELESVLENERKKAREVKERLDQQLDDEKKQRMDFESRLIRLREESQRRENYV